MILAAGRGERMRPLSDAMPKPLLRAGGKPLIVWQIEALARAGHADIVINAAHRADELQGALGDGTAFGVRIHWSLEDEPLETGGGIATASPLLAPGPVLIVSGDIWTRFDYSSLAERMTRIAADVRTPRVHLVMVPNPPYHPDGDFALDGEQLRLESGTAARLTFGNVGVYDTALFRRLPRGVRLRMLPLYQEWILRRMATGERFDGPWANIGTPADLVTLDDFLSRESAGLAAARPGANAESSIE